MFLEKVADSGCKDKIDKVLGPSGRRTVVKRAEQLLKEKNQKLTAANRLESVKGYAFVEDQMTRIAEVLKDCDACEFTRQIIREKLKDPLIHKGVNYAGNGVGMSSAPTVSSAEQAQVDREGRDFGDHHTGVPESGYESGHWVPDHIPPISLIAEALTNPELKTLMEKAGIPTTYSSQRLYPHSESSMRSQSNVPKFIVDKSQRLKKCNQSMK